MPICEICNTREANGSVGKINDPDFIQYVCEYCYYCVLEMSPLGDTNKSILKRNQEIMKRKYEF